MTPTLLPSRPLRLVLAVAVALGGHVFAQAPSATPAPVRPVPPPGVQLPQGDRAELQAGVVAFGKDITIARHNLQSKPELLALLPDVLIFHKAVDWALRYDEFFDVKQVATAKKLLELGNQRLSELKAGNPSWISATGLVPRGYISKIDGSVQPYGMVVPEDWKPGETTPRRLDIWCHGRGEKLSELDFVNSRLTQKGEFTPPGVLVLHLYGRYCCANKFAGETDLFEATENARPQYHFNWGKVVVRGFSMGGGACWQFGTHFAWRWAAVQPGAGFGDTKEFMKLGTTPDKPLPPEWEQTLWKWYDSVGYASNLANTTTVAYSGEIDGQKEAADIMIRYARQEAGNAHPPMAELGKVAPGDGSPKAAEARVTGTSPDLAFYHVIGLQTPHKIKPEEKPEVDSLVAAAVAAHNAQPAKGHWTTYTMIYPQGPGTFRLSGMEKEWERADLDFEKQPDGMKITTKNVTGFYCRDIAGAQAHVDGQTVPIPENKLPGESKSYHFWKDKGQWKVVLMKDMPAADEPPGPDAPHGLVKNATLCGPIDHAFMSSFIFVSPTGKPLNDKVGAWAKSEEEHATGFWRKVFRGEVTVKNDTEITKNDAIHHNLILWGDPSSNKEIAKIIAKLPLKWTATELVFNGQPYDASHTAPVLVFPNPEWPGNYVVINSGVTFREQALLNNADQTAKLPDWAIVDLNTPPDAKWPGEIKAAGFFDEEWKVPAK